MNSPLHMIVILYKKLIFLTTQRSVYAWLLQLPTAIIVFQLTGSTLKSDQSDQFKRWTSTFVSFLKSSKPVFLKYPNRNAHCLCYARNLSIDCNYIFQNWREFGLLAPHWKVTNSRDGRSPLFHFLGLYNDSTEDLAPQSTGNCLVWGEYSDYERAPNIVIFKIFFFWPSKITFQDIFQKHLFKKIGMWLIDMLYSRERKIYAVYALLYIN